MATVAFATSRVDRLSLATIDAVVSARLGPTRIPGNEQPACFNRQLAMYLARHVGGWSTTVIGRFYNGRDHSTVCYGIQRIESLRESNPDVDALITELKTQLGDKSAERTQSAGITSEFSKMSELALERLAEVIAVRVCAYLEERFRFSNPASS